MTRTWMVGLALVGCTGMDGDGGDTDAAIEFTAYEPPAAADVTTDRLCAEAATWDDPTTERYDIDCAFDGGAYAPSDPPPKDELVVMAWNMERNYQMQAQVDFFEDLPAEVPFPDVLIVSEVDRGCQRSAEVDGARVFAEAIGYDYVFGVEFTELPRNTGSETFTHPCEHGQAVFSRYPIGNVNLFRHPARGYDEWDDTSQPRLGTRADVEADIQVGDRYVRVVSVHYDDRPEEQPGRTEQAIGTADNHLDSPIPVVVGGDMNTAGYFLDLSPTSTNSEAARAMWERGWVDVHVDLEDRITVPFNVGGSIVPAVVDLMWMREADIGRSSSPGQCPVETCEGLSDHMPVWTTVALD